MTASLPADPRQILQERDRATSEIRAKVEWTEDAKNERIGEINRWAQQEYTEAKEAEQRRIEVEVVSSRRGVYGVPTEGAISAGEVEQVRAAFRGAWDDVLIRTPSEAPHEAKEGLEEILAQAERTGDSLLARAAYHRGLDLGIQSVVDRYLADKPKEARALERYNKALQESNQSKSLEGLFASAMNDQAFASGA